jgi:peptidoglycan/LPS O-acetylase OafA/YrhL
MVGSLELVMIIPHPYFFVMSFLILAGLFFSLPVFKCFDGAENQNSSRHMSLDAIRYFLASFVFFSHSLYLYNVVINNNAWGGHTSPEIAYLAEMGVTVFFMISAYLFWGIVKRSKDNMNWLELYKGRFFRIVPLVFFSTFCIIVTVTIITHEMPNKAAMDWFNVLAETKPDFSSFTNTWTLTAGVYWTLVYEWGFYFSLPLLSLFLRKPIELTISLLFLILYAGSFAFPNLPFRFIIMFIFGMLVSDLSDKIYFSARTLDILFLSTVALIFIIHPTTLTYSNSMNLLLALSLLCLVKGATVFGLLSFKGFKRLGDASFSIYIMHPLVIFICYKIAFKHQVLNEHILVISCLAYFLVLVVSLLTHQFIEKPFMTLGKKIKFLHVEP